AVDVLEGDERQLEGLAAGSGGRDAEAAVVVEADDVRVGRGDLGEAAQDVGLPFEALERLGLDGLGAEHLDGDPEAVGIAVVGIEDRSLPALAEDLADVVPNPGWALDHGAQQGVAEL